MQNQDSEGGRDACNLIREMGRGCTANVDQSGPWEGGMNERGRETAGSYVMTAFIA